MTQAGRNKLKYVLENKCDALAQLAESGASNSKIMGLSHRDHSYKHTNKM